MLWHFGLADRRCPLNSDKGQRAATLWVSGPLCREHATSNRPSTAQRLYHIRLSSTAAVMEREFSINGAQPLVRAAGKRGNSYEADCQQILEHCFLHWLLWCSSKLSHSSNYSQQLYNKKIWHECSTISRSQSNEERFWSSLSQPHMILYSYWLKCYWSFFRSK